MSNEIRLARERLRNIYEMYGLELTEAVTKIDKMLEGLEPQQAPPKKSKITFLNMLIVLGLSIFVLAIVDGFFLNNQIINFITGIL